MKINTIHFEKSKNQKLYIQLYEQIRNDILNGYMKYGDQLPSIRKLASQLSLSRTSIEATYQRLIVEGYIISKAQSGYFVDVDQKNAQLRKNIMKTFVHQEDRKPRFDLRSSSIDASSFDTSIWMHYMKEVLANEETIMSYGDSQGELSLRIALQKYMYAMRGVLSEEDQLVVGASFQSLLYLICSLYIGKKIVAMEVGGFPQAEQVFLDCGFRIEMIDHDEQGILIEQLQDKEIGILYINSASCGSEKKAIRTKRRNQLLAWAKDRDVLILEDDHNGELRYSSKMRPAMQGFDRGEQVIYIRSFSKLILPSLRMSFMVLNKRYAEVYQKRKANYNPSASKIEQLVLARYLQDGHLERQIRKLRKRYEKKSREFLRELYHYFDEKYILLDECALQIHLHFPQRDIDEMIAMARHKQIYIQKSGDEIVLSFAAIAQHDIHELVEELSTIW